MIVHVHEMMMPFENRSVLWSLFKKTGRDLRKQLSRRIKTGERHVSPSGYTAALLANMCEEQGYAYTLERRDRYVTVVVGEKYR